MAPSLISHYRLFDQLGEGGMGVVYRAEDLRLGREVAIKLLRTDTVVSAEWLARFEREARLASSLKHPHICMIHELGEHGGQPFIAMERLEGRTMKQMIEEGPIAPERVIHFASQIADALDAAHRRGIIHRDIKPANLFVTFGDHVKVLDFGLAKIALDDPRTATGLVATASSPTLVDAAFERPDPHRRYGRDRGIHVARAGARPAARRAHGPVFARQRALRDGNRPPRVRRRRPRAHRDEDHERHHRAASDGERRDP